MLKLSQAKFSEPDIATTKDEPLVIHQKSTQTSDRLVIFVHGLGGGRYGKNATWGNFPAFVFEDLSQVDVGLYQYVTLFERLKFWKSVKLNREAEVFADLIRDELSDYPSIVLIGHSMGGLLCKAVISHFVHHNETAVLSRIGGMVLMATPQLGSMRVPKSLQWLSSDFQALKPHGEFVTTITDTFQDYFHSSDERVVGFKRVAIPTWAVLGSSDFWVDRLSAGVGLSSDRKKMARGSHTNIVKPDTRSGVYEWVRERIISGLDRFKYDAFIASPMAAIKTEKQYQETRTQVIEIQNIMKATCRFKSIFFAGNDLKSKTEFDAADIALEDDMKILRDSRYFVLIYPQQVVSSVLFEAGWALAFGKPSVYFVRKGVHLPFLMAKAEQAHLVAHVRIYEYSSWEDIGKIITDHGTRLWLRA